ncbi:MAG: ATP synthase subunit I [Candidatus Izemoplasmatales bacterium]
MRNKDVIERTFIFAWPYAIVFSAILYLVTRDVDLVISFILGAATSLFVNSLNYKIMKSTYKHRQDKIMPTQILMFVLKYGFMALILYIAFTSDDYNEIYTFVGLFTFVIVTVPTAIIYSKRGDEEDE